MPVFVYDQSGLLEQHSENEWKQIGREVSEHNRTNPSSFRKILVGPLFPPLGFVFDPGIPGVRKQTLQEKIDGGLELLPDGFTIDQSVGGEIIVGPGQKIDSDGRLVEKTLDELIADGLVPFDAATQKIENEQVVPKTRQELLTDGILTLAEIRDQSILRLRTEIEQHFASAKTANGYRLDNLARQKAGVSLPFRTVDDADSQKAALLTSKVIYSNAVTDEILAAVEAVQAAYDQAKAAVEDAFAQSKPVADFEAIKLSNYLGS